MDLAGFAGSLELQEVVGSENKKSVNRLPRGKVPNNNKTLESQ